MILMTTINACICGKYDESQDLENDFQDKHGPLNEHVLLLDFLVVFCDFFLVKAINVHIFINIFTKNKTIFFVIRHHN
jgi:hypothetical protein